MFGDRLRELREDFNLTQEQLANKVDVNRSTISAYENNTINPTFDVVIKLANVFNVSIDYLACRTRDKYNITMQNKVTREAVTALITVLNKHIK